METKPIRNDGTPLAPMPVLKRWRLFGVAFSVVLVIFAPVVLRIFRRCEVYCVYSNAEQMRPCAFQQIDAPSHHLFLCGIVANDENGSIREAPQNRRVRDCKNRWS